MSAGSKARVGAFAPSSRIVVGLAAMLLAACGSGDSGTGPGGVTENEAKALDEAAEMIEQRRLPEPDAAPSAPPSGDPAPMPDQPAG